jgi:Tfp pilus assembly protein PilF
MTKDPMKNHLIVAGRMIAVASLALLLTGCNPPNSLLRQQAINAMEDKDIVTAEQRLERAVKQDDTDWKAMWLLGVVRNEQHRGLDAQILLERSLTLRGHDAETADINDALAESLFIQNQPASLSAMLQTAVEDHGGMRDYLRQAKYLGKSGDADGARKGFQKAIKFAKKDDPMPYQVEADYFESVGDKAGAIEALRHVYYISPGNGKVANRLRNYGIVPGPTVGLPPEE